MDSLISSIISIITEIGINLFSGIRGKITSKITSEKEVNGSWTNNNNIPNQNGVIHGFTEGQYVVNSITFSMTPDLGSPVRTPEANMRYVARVRLVISTV